jgi:hypothetical protein
MGLMDKAREAAEQARAGVLGDRPAAPPASEPDDPDAPLPPPPPPGGRASAAINSLVERINPGLLADLIIHATAAQEKTNKALREKGSQYRISEMYLTATIPPQVGFYIARVGDDPADAVALDAPALTAGEPVRKAAAKKRAPRPEGP